MNLQESYLQKKSAIRKRLQDFKSLPDKKYLDELLFCTLTPQSQAKKCWQAVLALKPLIKDNPSKEKISSVLKNRTRFHNNKTKYILKNLQNWKAIKKELSKSDIPALRNWLAENVYGFGLKEASHFLRNIGKSDNKVAILDRHILKNLSSLKVINDNKVKNRKQYVEIEDAFLNFSEKVNIPVDELDLLFWSSENGEIFK